MADLCTGAARQDIEEDRLNGDIERHDVRDLQPGEIDVCNVPSAQGTWRYECMEAVFDGYRYGDRSVNHCTLIYQYVQHN